MGGRTGAGTARRGRAGRALRPVPACGCRRCPRRSPWGPAQAAGWIQTVVEPEFGGGFAECGFSCGLDRLALGVRAGLNVGCSRQGLPVAEAAPPGPPHAGLRGSAKGQPDLVRPGPQAFRPPAPQAPPSQRCSEAGSVVVRRRESPEFAAAQTGGCSPTETPLGARAGPGGSRTGASG